ncbi:hypothetical protein I3760_04G180300 [Carya illinoinensis]|nr:hypothetical protein I3760_04G180300 [Carya illinoinensis]
MYSQSPFYSGATPSPSHFSFHRSHPWQQLVQSFSSFTRPYVLGEATLLNYALIFLLILFLGLMWHPISMIVFFLVFAAWCFLYFLRDEPLAILNRQVDDCVILASLAVVTIVALVLTDVWLNVLVSVLIVVVVVVLHAMFCGTEDLYYNEEADVRRPLVHV